MTHLLICIIYLAFVSLGLPDALLGAAWPTMHPIFDVPVSYAGTLSLIISTGTVVSSLLCDAMIKKFGTGKLTAFSTALTAVALLGFSFSGNYWMLCLWAIPYGFGAGSVDSALNNYVAIHYSSSHMSWLHCMWGLGVSVGPYVMGYALTGGMGWDQGYFYVSLVQMVITALLFFTLPMWKKPRHAETNDPEVAQKPLKMSQILSIPGAKAVFLMFFCYCAAEQTAGLWAASYLVEKDSIPADQAASLASLYFIGLTAGRGISGFVTKKLNDVQMVRLGTGIFALGLVIMLLPLGQIASTIGLILAGLGSAPIYPCVIHSTPRLFGEENSQAVIGVQMASAYVGICVVPPIFGLLADWAGAVWLPWFLAVFVALMIGMHEKMVQICSKNEICG